MQYDKCVPPEILQEIKKEADLVKEGFIEEIKLELDLEDGQWDTLGARNYRAKATIMELCKVHLGVVTICGWN